MPANTDLQMICDRGLSALAEVKQHAGKLANLQAEVERAKQELSGLQSQIETAKKLAQQLPDIDHQIRTRRAELASIDAQVAAAHVRHGTVTSALRDLRKQISGDPTHA